MRMRVCLHEPLRIPVVVCAPPADRAIRLGNALERQRILGDRVGDSLRVDEESFFVEVVDVISRLVVVDVESDTSFATEQCGFGLGLDFLGAGEEAARGNAVFEERSVIRAAAVDGGRVVELLAVEKGLEVLLDGVGARGPREVEAAAIAVVDAVDVVWRSNPKTELVRDAMTTCEHKRLTYRN
jgi:hypothetical protein